MELGKINKLKVIREEDKGYILFDEIDKEAFLSKEDLPNDLEIGEFIEVFIYSDQDKNYLATTKNPYIKFDEFAFLKVKSVNKFGAFIDWGLDTDLLVPFSEKGARLTEENWYLFFLLVDEKTERLIASRKINDFLFFDKIDVEVGDEVDLLLYQKTDLGMNAIVNNLYKGLIFSSDIHKNINPGDKIKGFVKQVREDGKIDIVLDPIGYKQSIDPNSDLILTALQKNDGILELNDKSSPEDIKLALGLSKKAFKKAIGSLYKQKKIVILKAGIRIIE